MRKSHWELLRSRVELSFELAVRAFWSHSLWRRLARNEEARHIRFAVIASVWLSIQVPQSASACSAHLSHFGLSRDFFLVCLATTQSHFLGGLPALLPVPSS